MTADGLIVTRSRSVSRLLNRTAVPVSRLRHRAGATAAAVAFITAFELRFDTPSAGEPPSRGYGRCRDLEVAGPSNRAAQVP